MGIMNRKELEQEKYNELTVYTLMRGDKEFIHQNVVDVFAAQQADENTKAIKLVFALIGLYLYLEKNNTGKEVQNAHIALSKKRKNWPILELPKERGDITSIDVMKTKPGDERDIMIKRWCVSVWHAYKNIRPEIINLVGKELGI
jgi:hypothetical protein